MSAIMFTHWKIILQYKQYSTAFDSNTTNIFSIILVVCHIFLYIFRFTIKDQKSIGGFLIRNNKLYNVPHPLLNLYFLYLPFHQHVQNKLSNFDLFNTTLSKYKNGTTSCKWHLINLIKYFVIVYQTLS